MSLSHYIRFSAILTAVALTAGVASAQRGGGHGGGGHAGGAHVGGAHVGGVHVGGVHPSTAHFSNGSRAVVVYGGYGGYGGGLYGLGYGGGYYGGGYGGGLGYGSLGYDYGYPGGSSLGVPVIPGSYYPQYQSIPPMLPAVDPNADPRPLPLPNAGAAPGAPAGAGETATAKITVITNAGAKVSFDGIESDQTGTRHSFTTRPISKNTDVRIKVVVDGSSISIGVRGGEAATVDMRK